MSKTNICLSSLRLRLITYLYQLWDWDWDFSSPVSKLDTESHRLSPILHFWGSGLNWLRLKLSLKFRDLRLRLLEKLSALRWALTWNNYENTMSKFLLRLHWYSLIFETETEYFGFSNCDTDSETFYLWSQTLRLRLSFQWSGIKPRDRNWYHPSLSLCIETKKSSSLLLSRS